MDGKNHVENLTVTLRRLVVINDGGYEHPWLMPLPGSLSSQNIAYWYCNIKFLLYAGICFSNSDDVFVVCDLILHICPFVWLSIRDYIVKDKGRPFVYWISEGILMTCSSPVWIYIVCGGISNRNPGTPAWSSLQVGGHRVSQRQWTEKKI